MKAISHAIRQSNQELEQKNKEISDNEAHIAKHTGKDADQRVAYVRDLVKKSEPDD
jgi:septal ring factor EnvC (AmiA/AmiB activator)